MKKMKYDNKHNDLLIFTVRVFEKCLMTTVVF